MRHTEQRTGGKKEKKKIKKKKKEYECKVFLVTRGQLQGVPHHISQQGDAHRDPGS